MTVNVHLSDGALDGAAGALAQSSTNVEPLDFQPRKGGYLLHAGCSPDRYRPRLDPRILNFLYGMPRCGKWPCAAAGLVPPSQRRSWSRLPHYERQPRTTRAG